MFFYKLKKLFSCFFLNFIIYVFTSRRYAPLHVEGQVKDVKMPKSLLAVTSLHIRGTTWNYKYSCMGAGRCRYIACCDSQCIFSCCLLLLYPA